MIDTLIIGFSRSSQALWGKIKVAGAYGLALPAPARPQGSSFLAIFTDWSGAWLVVTVQGRIFVLFRSGPPAVVILLGRAIVFPHAHNTLLLDLVYSLFVGLARARHQL